MPNRLELPDDLASLIEKREDADRRQSDEPSPATGERRTGADRRAEGAPPSPADDDTTFPPR